MSRPHSLSSGIRGSTRYINSNERYILGKRDALEWHRDTNRQRERQRQKEREREEREADPPFLVHFVILNYSH